MRTRVERFLASPAATTMVGWLTLGCVLLVVTLAFFTVPGIISNTEASRRTDELNACRAEYRSDIDLARIGVERASDARLDALGQMLSAAVQLDATTLGQVRAQLAAAETAVDDELAVLQQAADAYQVANTLSRVDPEAFLNQCQEHR